MEFKITSDKKNEMTFEIKDEHHSFSQLLVTKLLQNKDVDIAYYNIDHPLIGHPIFYVKTKKNKPITAVQKAISDLKKELKSVKL